MILHTPSDRLGHAHRLASAIHLHDDPRGEVTVVVKALMLQVDAQPGSQSQARDDKVGDAALQVSGHAAVLLPGLIIIQRHLRVSKQLTRHLDPLLCHHRHGPIELRLDQLLQSVGVDLHR